MSGKSKKKPTRDMTINKAVSHAVTIFMYAFCSEFSPEKEMTDRLQKAVASTRDSIMCGALTIPELRRALKQDYDWEV